MSVSRTSPSASVPWAHVIVDVLLAAGSGLVTTLISLLLALLTSGLVAGVVLAYLHSGGSARYVDTVFAVLGFGLGYLVARFGTAVSIASSPPGCTEIEVCVKTAVGAVVGFVLPVLVVAALVHLAISSPTLTLALSGVLLLSGALTLPLLGLGAGALHAGLRHLLGYRRERRALPAERLD